MTLNEWKHELILKQVENHIQCKKENWTRHFDWLLNFLMACLCANGTYLTSWLKDLGEVDIPGLLREH